jgi:hypothetical protein
MMGGAVDLRCMELAVPKSHIRRTDPGIKCAYN